MQKLPLALAAACQLAGFAAQAGETDASAGSGKIKSVWVNPGFFSSHFDSNKGLKENNYGLGVQLALSQASSVMGGEFRNSHDVCSRYLAGVWQPYNIGPARLGLLAGAIDGYPKMKNGGRFLVAMPVASLEYKAAGINLTIVPGYKDKLYGAVIVQFKLRVWQGE